MYNLKFYGAYYTQGNWNDTNSTTKPNYIVNITVMYRYSQ